MEKLKNIPVLAGQLICLLVLFAHTNTYAQYVVDNTSTMVIKGTSNIHDWESKVEETKGAADLTLEDNKLKSIQKLHILVPVTAIKSGKSVMDKNTYNALKESDHPQITYKLKSIKNHANGKMITIGDLTIGGKTKTIELPISYSFLGGNKIKFDGKIKIKMTEYGIEPPTAMMGSIKTGDEVEIVFQTIYKKITNNNI